MKVITSRCRMRYPNKPKHPVTSCVVLQGSGKRVKLVDVPGHPRLLSTFAKRVQAAAGVVYLLDSSTFIADKHAVAGCAPTRCMG